MPGFDGASVAEVSLQNKEQHGGLADDECICDQTRKAHAQHLLFMQLQTASTCTACMSAAIAAGTPLAWTTMPLTCKMNKSQELIL